MIYRIYKSNLSIVLVGLPFIIFGLWAGQIFDPINTEPLKNTGEVYGLLDSITDLFWVKQLLACALIVVSAIVLNHIINQEEFFQKQTYIPAYTYVLVMSIYPEYQILHPIIVANFFVIIAIRRLFQIHRSDDSRRMMFDAGLLIGVAAVFYQYYVGIYLLAWVTLAVLRPFVWREHLLGILGLAIPFGFVMFYHFMTDNLEAFYAFFIPQKQYETSFIATDIIKRSVGIGITLLMGVLGARFFLNRQKSSSLRFKRISNIILFMGLVVLLLTGVHVMFLYEAPTVFMSSIFASFLITFYFFYSTKQKLAAFVFYSVSLLIVVNIYYDLVYNIFS